jgi:hypothetical protein
MRNSDNRFAFLFGLSLTILLIILFFGLRGKGFHFSNGVAWIMDESGIRFGNYGIAYAFFNNDRNNISSSKAFSIEIAIKPKDLDLRGFNIILSLHDGKDSNQLIVGQWKSNIIVMNGDDYSNRRKIKRISADIFSEPPKKSLLTITTGDEGTKLYVDGKLIKAKSDLTLNIPEGNMLRVTLGNSVYGKHFWRGEVYGLALYSDRLAPETIETRFNAWLKNRIFPFAKDEKPVFSFIFNERRGTETIDYVTGIQKLNIPAHFHILEKRFLSLQWRNLEAGKSFVIDSIVNLLGFIPLGFILSALFIQSGGILHKRAILFSVALCFLTSLCIEIAQAWIPSRSSQASDLVLNTIGALIGAILGKPRIAGRLGQVSKISPPASLETHRTPE